MNQRGGHTDSTWVYKQRACYIKHKTAKSTWADAHTTCQRTKLMGIPGHLAFALQDEAAFKSVDGRIGWVTGILIFYLDSVFEETPNTFFGSGRRMDKL